PRSPHRPARDGRGAGPAPRAPPVLPVPSRDRLVVAERLGPLLAHLEEALAEVLVELAPQDRAAVLERLEQLGGDALVGRPREGQSLDAFRVGVLRRGKAALWEPQLAQHVVDGLLGDLAVALLAGHDPGMEVERRE